MAIAKKKAALPGRAWRLLRLAVLWARRGGVFNRCLKSLKLGGGGADDSLHFGEREFSLEETPVFHLKTNSMWLLRIPCITPVADFDNDDDDNLVFARHDSNSYLPDDETREASEIDCEESDDVPDQGGEFVETEEEDRIDWKAEQFIEKFHEQLKRQRQISFIQDNEMLLRGV